MSQDVAMSKATKRKVEEVLDGFDFDEMVRIMYLTEHKWRSKNGRDMYFPDAERIKTTARSLLEGVAESDELHINSSGGLSATCTGESLSLSYEAVRKEVYKL